MSPHTLLSNSANVTSLETPLLIGKTSGTTARKPKQNSTSSDFSSYVQKLLEHQQEDATSGLLSPTDDETRSLSATVEQPSNVKECIDFAILTSNTSTSTNRSANRFEITRNGEKVAVIMLSRPAYRLGETVPIAIDFREVDVTCYSLRATLETSESIDPALALRSKASVQRVTRRVHASHHESTISSERVLFNPMIPTTATPEFITTGVNLEWNLRFEFVTEKSGAFDEFDEDFDGLMEEVAKDDRGTVKAAAQGLPCETFDVAVPLRVYGATSAFDENTESGSFPI